MRTKVSKENALKQAVEEFQFIIAYWNVVRPQYRKEFKFNGVFNFCEVEKLTGDNKYYCEKCKRKCNAQKQFLFKECKYITNIIQYSSSNPNSSFKAI